MAAEFVIKLVDDTKSQSSGAQETPVAAPSTEKKVEPPEKTAPPGSSEELVTDTDDSSDSGSKKGRRKGGKKSGQGKPGQGESGQSRGRSKEAEQIASSVSSIIGDIPVIGQPASKLFDAFGSTGVLDSLGGMFGKKAVDQTPIVEPVLPPQTKAPVDSSGVPFVPPETSKKPPGGKSEVPPVTPPGGKQEVPPVTTPAKTPPAKVPPGGATAGGAAAAAGEGAAAGGMAAAAGPAAALAAAVMIHQEGIKAGGAAATSTFDALGGRELAKTGPLGESTANMFRGGAEFIGERAGSMFPVISMVVGPIIETAMKAVDSIKQFVFSIFEALGNEAARLSKFSPELASATAESKISTMELDIERADRLGPQLANFERAKSRFDDEMQRIWTEILSILLDLFDMLGPFVEFSLDSLEASRRSIASLRDVGELIIAWKDLDWKKAEEKQAHIMEEIRDIISIFYEDSRDSAGDQPAFDRFWQIAMNGAYVDDEVGKNVFAGKDGSLVIEVEKNRFGSPP